MPRRKDRLHVAVRLLGAIRRPPRTDEASDKASNEQREIPQVRQPGGSTERDRGDDR